MTAQKILPLFFLFMVLGAFALIGVNAFQAIDDSSTITSNDTMSDTYNSTTTLASVGFTTMSFTILFALIASILVILKIIVGRKL